METLEPWGPAAQLAGHPQEAPHEQEVHEQEVHEQEVQVQEFVVVDMMASSDAGVMLADCRADEDQYRAGGGQAIERMG
jgi:hypothetical protein